MPSIFLNGTKIPQPNKQMIQFSAVLFKTMLCFTQNLFRSDWLINFSWRNQGESSWAWETDKVSRIKWHGEGQLLQRRCRCMAITNTVRNASTISREEGKLTYDFQPSNVAIFPANPAWYAPNFGSLWSVLPVFVGLPGRARSTGSNI